MTAVHVPVMLERTLALLAPAVSGPGAVVVDATLGLGGHSEALLARHPDLRLVGIDRDPEALSASRGRLAPYADRTTLVHAIYDELPRILTENGLSRVHGILFDLGVSSLQLDESGRGFSYAHDAPLDMRMDPSQGQTAADVLNTYPAQNWPGSSRSTATSASRDGSPSGLSARAMTNRLNARLG